MKQFVLSIVALFFANLVFAQNNAPTYLSAQTQISSTICVSSYNNLYDQIVIEDLDADALSVISFVSSNQSVVADANINVVPLQQIGNLSYFLIQGQVDAPGTFSITLTLSDGSVNVPFTLTNIIVDPLPIPTFNTSFLTICSGSGITDLNDYVDITGGSFYFNSLEYNFTDGILDPATFPANPGDTNTLSYETYVNGCYGYTEIDLSFHISPTVSISATGTACGAATGSAIATVINGTAPFSNISWTNGATNTYSVNNLAAGVYSFSLSDAYGCEAEKTFTINPLGVNLIGSITNNTCYGQTNGEIAIGTTGLTSPVTYLWSTGYSTPTISNLIAGTYTVTATDANNCSITQDFVVTAPDELMVETYSSTATCGAADAYADASTVSGGIAPYTHAWSNGDINPVAYNLPFGIYSVTVTDLNGCQAIKTFYISESNSADLYGDITKTDCGLDNGAVDLSYYIYSGGNVQSISWSNGATTEDISGLAPNNYVCTFTVDNGCKAIKGWNIPILKPLKQDICVVTVDSATTTNLLVWEKVQPIGIAYYKIYRESSTPGDFVLIDTVAGNNISLFNDVVASPIVKSWSYKISAVNGCEEESPLSSKHRTIHLDIFDNGTGVDVNWNSYIGTNFTSYNIWRYTDATGWVQIDNVPASQLNYSDIVPFSTPGLDYMVDFSLSSPCSAEKAQDYNTVRSNRERGQFAPGEGTGDSNNGIDEAYLSSILVYPNPVSDELIIAQSANEKSIVRVLNLAGQTIETFEINSTQTVHSVSHLSNGMYILEISHKGISNTRRIVKN